jgi:hypothetical protein
VEPLTAGQWATLGMLLASSGGGIWFIARQVIRNQSDFIERYASDTREHRERIEKLEDELIATRRRELACQAERAALRVAVRSAGVPWAPPAEWELEG